MNTQLCQRLGVDFPLFAFSHCRDVVVAVSRAGGFGVFGAARYSPEELELELRWIDQHVDGRPYGVDVLVPENMTIRDESGFDAQRLASRFPRSTESLCTICWRGIPCRAAGSRAVQAMSPSWPTSPSA